MLHPVSVTSCGAWDPPAAARSQGREPSASPDDHNQREILNKTYQKALEALEAASAVVANVASSLYDVEASQTDVSARLCGRPVRFTGKKRKLSPSVYDYSESCFGAAPKADTPTQELLPASRSELRSHQLQAVRWLVSLEHQGAGGMLADELDQDRRAEVAGLLSHLASNPPDVFPPPPPHSQHALQQQHQPLQQHQPQALSPLSVASQQYQHHHYHQQQQSHGGGGGGDGQCGGGGSSVSEGPGGVCPGGGAGGGGSGGNVCVLLAPASSLVAWSESIQEHVDVIVHLYDGTAASAAVLQAACAAAAAGGSAGGPGASVLAPYAGSAGCASGHLARRSATGGACPPSSSAAGVFPPLQHSRPAPSPVPPQSSSSAAAAAASAHQRPEMRAGGPRLLVILSPLEHLHRDVALLSQIHQRLMIVDLAPCGGSSGGAATAGDSRFGRAAGGCGDSGGGSSGDQGYEHFSVFGVFGSAPGSGSGSGQRGATHIHPRGEGHAGRRRRGLELEGYPHLHLLTRMPAESRVLLSAGVPDPAGDGIWLLLQLLAPAVQRPLWVAICELQHALLATGSVGAQHKESVLSEVHGRLWALLRPLMLHRRARDVDLTTMRSANTNLNLYDHFSAARAEGA